MISDEMLLSFAIESSDIEEIAAGKEPLSLPEEQYEEHAQALKELLSLDIVTQRDLEKFVFVVQPDAELRSRARVPDVYIGGKPCPAWYEVVDKFPKLLQKIAHSTDLPANLHKSYENLHPFTDGNGRSGRALWLWQMVRHYNYDGRFLFLQMYYYQTL